MIDFNPLVKDPSLNITPTQLTQLSDFILNPLVKFVLIGKVLLSSLFVTPYLSRDLKSTKTCVLTTCIIGLRVQTKNDFINKTK